MATRWRIAGPGYVFVCNPKFPKRAFKAFKVLMADIRKDLDDCPRLRPMKRSIGYYAEFASWVAAVELRHENSLIFVSHVAAIDLKKSTKNPVPAPFDPHNTRPPTDRGR